MSEALRYPKRLIEVDLPIKRISAHARREKSLRHGQLSALHIWWARRPLGACRAVACAALWLDPTDDLCPETFRNIARREMRAWATTHLALLSDESYKRFNAFAKDRQKLDDPAELQKALLDFIADFANSDNSLVQEFLDTSRMLTQAAHEALGGSPGTRPLVIDPFAGGGAIPLESLRIGCDAFASDLNPVAVLLNRVLLEIIPRYGSALADEFERWGQYVQERCEERIGQFYPSLEDGTAPSSYLWARTVCCEGPGCGAVLPLLRSTWLAKRKGRGVKLSVKPDVKTKSVDLVIVEAEPGEPDIGTVKGGAATCPLCGYTTPVTRVRAQLAERRGGAHDARLLGVVVSRSVGPGKSYKAPRNVDMEGAFATIPEVEKLRGLSINGLSIVPNEPPPPDGTGSRGGGYRTRKYGLKVFADFFTPRQLLQHVNFSAVIRSTAHEMDLCNTDAGLRDAVLTLLALAADRQTDRDSAFCRWISQTEAVGYTFGRQAIPMLWDFVESPALRAPGGWASTVSDMAESVRAVARGVPQHRLARVECTSATAHPLPTDSAQCLLTDPPYYDSVPYGELSDFFYVWLRRSLSGVSSFTDTGSLTPRDFECVVNLAENKDKVFFERTMTAALQEARRVVAPDGVGVVVFAHKSTRGWEAQLQAMADAGWVVTASWPIDTERPGRLRAQNSAALASSIHLVCRPREAHSGSLGEDVGDWRAILEELPGRIHDWMPRLAAEGVVGADAIFACLGPALEIFSRYSRVERASGEIVLLREYLEQVWAAVSREALSMIFADPDTAGLDEDARLTAMWLWTIAAPNGASDGKGADEDDVGENTDEDAESMTSAVALGFTLEFDAARKIAQGLGARLEALEHVVEVKGDKARLLSAAERTTYLFGGSDGAPAERKKSKKKPQRALFEELEEVAEQQGWGEVGTPKAGSTTLDRVHQAMILFGAGRGEAMKRFLVDEGVGRGAQFWKLAQALSALYPTGTDEKRWVDGVLARKKGLGF